MLPTLYLKSKERNKKSSHIKMSDDLRTNNTGLIIQEQNKYGSQTLIMHQLSARNNKPNSDLMTFEPSYRAQFMNTESG